MKTSIRYALVLGTSALLAVVGLAGPASAARPLPPEVTDVTAVMSEVVPGFGCTVTVTATVAQVSRRSTVALWLTMGPAGEPVADAWPFAWITVVPGQTVYSASDMTWYDSTSTLNNVGASIYKGRHEVARASRATAMTCPYDRW